MSALQTGCQTVVFGLRLGKTRFVRDFRLFVFLHWLHAEGLVLLIFPVLVFKFLVDRIVGVFCHFFFLFLRSLNLQLDIAVYDLASLVDFGLKAFVFRHLNFIEAFLAGLIVAEQVVNVAGVLHHHVHIQAAHLTVVAVHVIDLNHHAAQLAFQLKHDIFFVFFLCIHDKNPYFCNQQKYKKI